MWDVATERTGTLVDINHGNHANLRLGISRVSVSVTRESALLLTVAKKNETGSVLIRRVVWLLRIRRTMYESSALAMIGISPCSVGSSQRPLDGDGPGVG